MISKHRLMQLAGLIKESEMPLSTSNAFKTPGFMAKVNQAQEIQQELEPSDDTVPSDVEANEIELDFN